MTVWLNGALTGSGMPVIEPSDRGFLLADGLFETLLAREGRPLFFDAHLDRLERSAEELALPIPASRKKITAAPLGKAPDTVTAITAAIRRNETSPAARMKTLAYLDNILARREANAKGAGEALMLNTKGRLACGTIGNLFLWKGAALFTPALEEGVLPGITRAQIIALAEEEGLTCREAPLEPDTLRSCDGAFLTNSLVGLPRIRKVDGEALPDHALTGQLEAAYLALLEKEATKEPGGE